MAAGRAHSIQEAASASAWGARSAMARNPPSRMRGRRSILKRRFTENPSVVTFGKLTEPTLLKNPALRGCAQLLQSLLAPGLAVHAHHGFGPGQPVADP